MNGESAFVGFIVGFIVGTFIALIMAMYLFFIFSNKELPEILYEIENSMMNHYEVAPNSFIIAFVFGFFIGLQQGIGFTTKK